MNNYTKLIHIETTIENIDSAVSELVELDGEIFTAIYNQLIILQSALRHQEKLVHDDLADER